MLLFDLAHCCTVLPLVGGIGIQLPGKAGIFVRFFWQDKEPGLGS